jgi:hypothetical protein
MQQNGLQYPAIGRCTRDFGDDSTGKDFVVMHGCTNDTPDQTFPIGPGARNAMPVERLLFSANRAVHLARVEGGLAASAAAFGAHIGVDRLT